MRDGAHRDVDAGTALAGIDRAHSTFDRCHLGRRGRDPCVGECRPQRPPTTNADEGQDAGGEQCSVFEADRGRCAWRGIAGLDASLGRSTVRHTGDRRRRRRDRLCGRGWCCGFGWLGQVGCCRAGRGARAVAASNVVDTRGSRWRVDRRSIRSRDGCGRVGTGLLGRFARRCRRPGGRAASPAGSGSGRRTFVHRPCRRRGSPPRSAASPAASPRCSSAMSDSVSPRTTT